MTIIDAAARNAAVSALLAFAERKIDSWQFQDLWPRSTNDVAVREIGRVLWSTYSDDVPSLASIDAVELYRRAALFLQTSQQYRWRLSPARWKTLLALPLSLLTLGRANAWLFEQIDMEVWPFQTREERDSALSGESPGGP